MENHVFINYDDVLAKSKKKKLEENLPWMICCLRFYLFFHQKHPMLITAWPRLDNMAVRFSAWRARAATACLRIRREICKGWCTGLSKSETCFVNFRKPWARGHLIHEKKAQKPHISRYLPQGDAGTVMLKRKRYSVLEWEQNRCYGFDRFSAPGDTYSSRWWLEARASSNHRSERGTLKHSSCHTALVSVDDDISEKIHVDNQGDRTPSGNLEINAYDPILPKKKTT